MLSHVHDIRRIRPSLTLNSATTLANSLVHSHLDYCNSLLFGLPKYAIQRLQKVQNCLCRVVTNAAYDTPATPILQSLHWLPISFRINNKICLLTHRILEIGQPSYLASLLSKRPCSEIFVFQSAGPWAFDLSFASPHL